MISLIEALNYRCLRYVRQEVAPFHVVVGPNASGKTTFLDVLGFLHDLVTKGVKFAVESRSSSFYDLVWRQEGHTFELAVEAAIPQTLCDSLENRACTMVRYEVAIGLDKTTNRLQIAAEQALLKGGSESRPTPQHAPPETLLEQRVLDSQGSLNPNFLFAMYPGSEGRYVRAVRVRGPVPVMEIFHPGSLLGGLMDADFVPPVSRWLRACLVDGIERMQLDPCVLRTPSPPGQGNSIGFEGANLPWAIARLQRESPERLHNWVEHLQTALPDLVRVTTIERPEDRHRHLSLEYRDGLTVPSWMVSDGTLRLLALTLPAYFLDFQSVLLVEEPENGLHPLAIETVYQSLSSVYDGQVLLVTHCPLLVAVAKPSEVLCFSRDSEGATQIVSGDRHPRLSDWRGEVDLGTLFASGVLG
ncbi:MAG: ATP-binding protein [Planctomycetota bacterium]